MTLGAWQILISGTVFAATFMFIYYGWGTLASIWQRQVQRYERVLVHELMIEINPNTAVGLALACILGCSLAAGLLTASLIWAVLGAGAAVFVPNVIIRHLEQKRIARLDVQLIDGIVTLASGVRAGLTMVQAIELLVRNTTGPIHQEFAQLLREYQMGLDLNQAMRNVAKRVGSPHYRLLFSAIEMHRQRGGDSAESLDRIAASIRELQRLEGKLDALTSHGRYQANLMATMLLGVLFMYFLIEPQSVMLMFSEPLGRVFMMIAVAMIAGAFFWIRRIMAVDL
jgi:tight adherence protein B